MRQRPAGPARAPPASRLSLPAPQLPGAVGHAEDGGEPQDVRPVHRRSPRPGGPRACQSRTPGSHRAHARPPDPRRRLRRLCPLAVLRCRSAPIATSTAMSATSGIDEARFLAAFRRELAHMAALAPGRTRHERLLRRRHAVADGAGDGGRAARRHRGGAGRSRPTPRSRSRPTRPRSRPRAFAAIAAAGVNRVSLGVQALNDADLARARPHAHAPRRRSPRSRIAR